MSDNGDESMLELSSGELEGENSVSSKFKCNLSVDNIPLTMGLNSDYCNNGGTSASNLGLNLLQNFDESNLFQCDISGVFEWIRQRTDSVSSADLECMRIDSNEAIVTTELTSSKEETVGAVGAVGNTEQIDPSFSTSLSAHSQSAHLNSTLLDELTCLQTDDQLGKSDTESLINESVFQYSLVQKNIGKFGTLYDSNNLPPKKTSESLSKESAGPANLDALSGEDKKTKLKILKASLPFIKVPKKCILSGKILKRDSYPLFTKNLLPALSEQQNLDLPESQEIQTPCVNRDIETLSQTDFSSETVCVNGFDSSEIQLMLTENSIKSSFINENLQAPESECLLSADGALDNQEKSGAKTVVAISTNKLEDVTEVCIKTKKGEELYKGKASELLKATNSSPNLLLRFDTNSKDKQKNQLHNLGTLNLKTSVDECNAVEADDDKIDDGIMNEDEPITEALKAMGITNDQLDNFQVVKGQQKSWFCPVSLKCDNVFNKLSSLKIHILTHYKLRPFKCNYVGCEWSFYTNFRLKRHKETHLRKKEFKCTLENCNRSFTTIYNLHTHLKLHERPADLLCPVPGCELAFQTKRNMESHLKEHGTEHAPYACVFEGCEKRYYSPSALNSHSRTHMHNINDLKCEYCFKIFDKPCRLKAHVRSHTGVKPYKCNYEGCVWAFTTSSKLLRHQAKHTQERRFVCNLCCKAFLRSEHLKDHTLKHFLTKAFICPYEGCGQQFTAKSSLYVHLKKHRMKDGGNLVAGSIEKSNGFVSLLPNTNKLTCPVGNCRKVLLSKDEITTHIQESHSNIKIELKDLRDFDSIELMNGDDNLISLEGLQFRSDTSTSGLNLANISPEGVVISLPEYINNAEISGLSILNTSSSIGQVEFSTNIQNNSSEAPRSDISLSNIYTSANTQSVDIGSARTGLTYQDTVADRESRKSKKPSNFVRKRGSAHSGVSSKESNTLKVASDIVLTAGLLGGSQDNLSRGLMIQDDLASSADLYTSISEETSLLDSASGNGEFLQVFIVDSTGRNPDFEQSTINLRDLE